MRRSKDQHGLSWLASVQATQSGLIDLNSRKIPAHNGESPQRRRELLTVYQEGGLYASGQAFWQSPGLRFEAFFAQVMTVDQLATTFVWMRRWSFLLRW